MFLRNEQEISVLVVAVVSELDLHAGSCHHGSFRAEKEWNEIVFGKGAQTRAHQAGRD